MNPTNRLNRNIKLFYLVDSVFIPFFWLSTLYFYLRYNKGLGEVQTLFLLGIQEFLLIFLEIPTGVIADKISRRFSVALGYILTSLPFLLFPFAHMYILYILIFVVKAIGKALISGADTSLLFDLLKDYGQTERYKKIISTARFFDRGVVAICIFVGGLIAKTNMELPLLLPFPFMVVGAIAVLLIDEPKTSTEGKKLQHSNYLIHTKEAFTFLIHNKPILILTLLFALSEALGVNLKWFYPPIFSALNFDIAIIGGITAVLYLVKSVLSLISAKIMAKSAYTNILITLIGLSLFFILSALLFSPTMVVLAMLGIILASQILEANLEENIHTRLNSKDRATVMSMINAITSIGATIMLLIFGFLNGSLGIQWSLLALGIMFVSGLITLVLSKKTLAFKAPVN